MPDDGLCHYVDRPAKRPRRPVGGGRARGATKPPLRRGRAKRRR